MFEYPLAVSFSIIYTFIVAVDSWNFIVLTVVVIFHYSQNYAERCCRERRLLTADWQLVSLISPISQRLLQSGGWRLSVLCQQSGVMSVRHDVRRHACVELCTSEVQLWKRERRRK